MGAMRRPAEVFPPGEFLRDELDERGWTQADFAEIIGRPTTLVNDILTGKRRVSPELAQAFGAALGTSADLWMNLESAYQLWQSGETSGLPEVGRRARMYGLAPIKEMVKRRWIEPSENLEIVETQILGFFQIQTLDDEPVLLHAARKSTSYKDTLSVHQRAWLYRAFQLGQNVDVGPFDRENLPACVASLKALMKSPEDVALVPGVLAEAGIRFIVVEPLKGKGSKIDGACILEGERPIIAMSLRFKRLDNFWFVLMHELGHLNDGIASADTFAEELDTDEKPEAEQRADAFARDAIVPQPALTKFVRRSRHNPDLVAIRAFAEEHAVHPSLIVGQLQHKGVLSYAQFQRVHADVRPFLVNTAVTDGWNLMAL